MTSAPAFTAQPEKIVPRRHPGRAVSYVVIALVAAAAIHSTWTNPNFGWDIVGSYFFSTRILAGLWQTIQLTVVAMVLGVVLGVVIAVMRLSDNPALSTISLIYLWVFRGTPVFVQLLFWGFISALYPTISLSIPFGPTIASASANAVITPVVAAILGLALNEAAYMAEIVRAGLNSVDPGQTEAAQALGMSRMRALRRIVLPQAMRVIVPPTGNETINMLKTTSLVSVLAFPELLYAAQLIYSDNFQTIPLLITASLWYLLVTSLLTIAQHYIERHFNRSNRPQGRPNRRQQLAGKRLPRRGKAGTA